MIVGVIAEELLLPLAIPPVSIYVDPDIFPSPSIRVPGFLLFEGPFNADDTFYPSYIGDIDNSIYPPLIVDQDTVYAFTTTRSIAISPPLFTDVDVIYSPIVLSKVLGPALLVDVDVFGGVRKLTQGKATINQTFPIDPVVDVDIIYGAVVGYPSVILVTHQALLSIPDDVIHVSETTTSTIPTSGSFLREMASYITSPPLGHLLPGVFSDSDILFAPGILGPIIPSFVQDIDVFYPPVRLNYLAPVAIPAGDAFFTPFVGWKLVPGVVTDQDVFIGPTFTRPGAMGLVVDPAESIPAPTVTPQRADVIPLLLNDSDAFYMPSANAALVPSYVVDVDTTFVPVARFGPLTPVVSVVDPEPIYAPVVGAGPLVPNLIVDPDALLVPRISYDQALTAGFVTVADIFYVPAIVAVAGFNGTIALDGPINPSATQPTVILIEG